MKENYITHELAINVEGQEVRTRCKALIRNPEVGALIFLFPKNIPGCPFKYILATFRQSTGHIKFWVQEYEELPHKRIGEYIPGNAQRSGMFSSPYELFDMEEAWFQKIHSEGLDRLLVLIPVIFSTYLVMLESKEPLESA